ncbi:MAG: hypothetical protein V1907_04360 [Candidatus Kerfeldbacteria bacterium]
MDILAHGLVTYVIASAKKTPHHWKWLVLFGILPDLIWLPATTFWLVTEGRIRFSLPLYDISHSLIVWAAVTLFAMLYFRRVYMVTWPWAVHILIDIPGHRELLTPLLWPVSRFTVHGWWDWLSMPWLIVTYVALLFVLSGVALRNRDIRN